MKITKNMLKQLIKEYMTSHWNNPGREVQASGTGVPWNKKRTRAYDDTMAWSERPPGRHLEKLDVSPYHVSAQAALKGSASALKDLQNDAKHSPDAQALLDAVYEKKPELKPELPQTGLSPAELAAITDYREYGDLPWEEPHHQDLNESKKVNKIKITKQQLKQLVKEEMENLFREQEEITTTKRTFGDKLTAIVNAWGGYRNAIARNAGVEEAAKKLIKVFKSYNMPRETAMKIYRAEKQDDVVALVKGGAEAAPGPQKPAEKGADSCTKAKDFFARAKKKRNIDKMRKGKKLIDKYCK